MLARPKLLALICRDGNGTTRDDEGQRRTMTENRNKQKPPNGEKKTLESRSRRGEEAARLPNLQLDLQPHVITLIKG